MKLHIRSASRPRGRKPIPIPKVIICMLLCAAFFTQAQAEDLGNLIGNPYDPDSTSNQFGRYGSPFSPDSLNNSYGQRWRIEGNR